MPLSVNNLGHQFKVGTVNKVFDTDTSVNIVKRREEITYRTSLQPSGANIALVASQAVTSDNNLSIADRSTSLLANRITETTYTTITGTKTFTINTENFVVTDVFADATSTINALPLFYKHTLSTVNVPRVDPDNEDYSLDSGVSLVSVQLLDESFQPVKTAEIKKDLTTGIIYNNLLSEYSGVNNYLVYYIKYTVNDNGNINTFIDLLDNIPTYRIATFDDLTPTLEIITDGRKVYLIEESSGEFSVTLPVVGTYAFQPLSSARIEILPPVSSNISETWFVRVTNGTFFTNVNGNLLKYYIAEFLTQIFTPEPPIKQVIAEYSTRLSNNLIKLDHDNIFEDDDLDLRVSILVNDSDGNGVAAFTTDDTIVGQVSNNTKIYEKWNNISKRGIRSIDHRTGVLDIEGVRLRSTYTIESSYYYNETNYEFTLINFNPISNREVLSTRTTLFIDPDTILENSSQTLFFIKTNEAGKVIESNWSDFDNDSQTHISGDILYYEKLPSFLTTGIADIGEPNYVDPDSITYFVDSFTVEGTENGSFLILGDITVSESFDPSQVTKFDARRRGGGIIDESYQDVLALAPEAAWYWDEGYWDGIPYPGNASYMVEVPVDVLQGAGGQLTQSEVKDVIERHTAAGVYPVAKAYGVEITVTGIEPGANSITLGWTSNGF